MHGTRVQERAGRILFLAAVGVTVVLAAQINAWASQWNDQSTVSFTVTAGRWTQPQAPNSNAPAGKASGPLAAKPDGGSDNSASSATSNVAASAPAPAAPSGLSAAVDGGAVKLTWSPTEGAAFYNIYRSDTSASGYLGIGSAVTPAFSDTGVTLGSTYYYVVTAVGPTNAQSVDSNEATATPRPTIAPPPARRAAPTQGPVGIAVYPN